MYIVYYRENSKEKRNKAEIKTIQGVKNLIEHLMSQKRELHVKILKI